MSTQEVKSVRRVVTGHNSKGQSIVSWDGPAPSVRGGENGANKWTDLWVWNEPCAPISGANDDGNLTYDFPGPPKGGHLRIVHGQGKPAHYDPAKDQRILAPHAPKPRPSHRVWDRGGRNLFNSDMHKTETVDYAILLNGQRRLILDDCEIDWKPGDVVIQVGAYHQWSSPDQGGDVMYDMIASPFTDGLRGLAQGQDKILTADPKRVLPGGAKAARRIVTIDRELHKGSLVVDGPTPDVCIDEARPGFSSSRLWVTRGPAEIVYESLHLPRHIQPPVGGSVMSVNYIPPDESWKGKVGSAQVQAFFKAMGSPEASTYAGSAPHPYMQKTKTLDFCTVLEGELVLILDTQEVVIKAGEVVILRGANHAWANRSNHMATLAIAAHDGK
jgi:hypothetical protein